MDASTLHPNLAVLAARYDDVADQARRGLLDPAEAHRRIAVLEARDDAGTRWRIDPASGAWERLSVARGWELATPPTFGLATPTPLDVSPPGGVAPAPDVAVRPVDEAGLYAGRALAGSTRGPRRTPEPERPAWVPRREGRVLLPLSVTGGLVVALLIARLLTH